MSIVHHVLAITPPPAAQENRIIYTITFAGGCVWLFLLILWQNFRSWHDFLPGKAWTGAVLTIMIIILSAIMLH